MTFTEAAVEVLRLEGKPLHFRKIAEIAVRESLLDHVGKIPEDVMGGQLANHCRLPSADRKVGVVQSGTFALMEWGLDEDPSGLAGMLEPPVEDPIPYRPRERHPIPSRDMARTSGRSEARPRPRREEVEERRVRRYPPPAEVAYEILAGADHPLTLAEVAAQGAVRLLMPEAFVREGSALAAALVEDNRRREGAGRRPLFTLDGDSVSLAVQPEPGERPAAVTPPAAVRAVSTPADLRRLGLLALRRRLSESDPATVEHVVAKLLERMELREVKVAKRGRDHVVYTARRRMGLGDVRHCIRILRGGGEAGRRDVQEVRRDVGSHGAQIGVVVSAGDAARDARSEATAPGQLPVLLLCGEALAEALAELELGVRLVSVPEVDDAFFKAAAEAAGDEESARRPRRDDRERRDGREAPQPQRAASPDGARREVRSGRSGEEDLDEMELFPVATVPAPRAVEVAASDEGEDDDEDEGDEDDGSITVDASSAGADGPEVEGAGAAEGDRSDPRRKRRRRRRRGGRGRAREGGAAASSDLVVPVAGQVAGGGELEAPPAATPESGAGPGDELAEPSAESLPVEVRSGSDEPRPDPEPALRSDPHPAPLPVSAAPAEEPGSTGRPTSADPTHEPEPSPGSSAGAPGGTEADR